MIRLAASTLSCSVLMTLLTTLAAPVSAQIPTPEISETEVEPTRQSRFAEPYREEPLPQIPDFTREFLMPFDRKNEVVQPTRRYRADQDAAMQEMRGYERKQDFQAGGFQWYSLRNAGESTFKYLEERGADKNALIKAMDYIDMTITDLDGDNNPDIILQHWDWVGDCGISGCVYDIYFGNKSRIPESVIGHRAMLHARGILIDNGFIVYRPRSNKLRR